MLIKYRLTWRQWGDQSEGYFKHFHSMNSEKAFHLGMKYRALAEKKPPQAMQFRRKRKPLASEEKYSSALNKGGATSAFREKINCRAFNCNAFDVYLDVFKSKGTISIVTWTPSCMYFDGSQSACLNTNTYF